MTGHPAASPDHGRQHRSFQRGWGSHPTPQAPRGFQRTGRLAPMPVQLSTCGRRPHPRYSRECGLGLGLPVCPPHPHCSPSPKAVGSSQGPPFCLLSRTTTSHRAGHFREAAAAEACLSRTSVASCQAEAVHRDLRGQGFPQQPTQRHQLPRNWERRPQQWEGLPEPEKVLHTCHRATHLPQQHCFDTRSIRC